MHTPAALSNYNNIEAELLRGFELRQLVLNILVKEMRIGAHQPAPVHKDRRSAADLQLLFIGLAGFDRRSSLRASHTCAKGVGIKASLTREVGHLRPGIGCRN